MIIPIRFKNVLYQHPDKIKEYEDEIGRRKNKDREPEKYPGYPMPTYGNYQDNTNVEIQGLGVGFIAKAIIKEDEYGDDIIFEGMDGEGYIVHPEDRSIYLAGIESLLALVV